MFFSTLTRARMFMYARLHQRTERASAQNTMKIFAIIQQAALKSTYLEVFDVWEGDSNGDDGPGIVISEVQPFTHFAPTDGNEQRAVCNEQTYVSTVKTECKMNHAN